jgi:adenylate kinase family enzyme
MKKFVWIIGKPGSGKTTVGDCLAERNDSMHLSYGELLKNVQPHPAADGYSMEDREKVNEIILEASKNHSTIVVDGNPYSKIGFGFLEQIKSGFDALYIVHLLINDTDALLRLENRNRKVLAHDGSSQKERIQNFNTKLLPLIEEYKGDGIVNEIAVDGLSSQEVSEIIFKIIQ